MYIYAAKSVLKSGHEECEINSRSGDAPNSEEIIARISDIRSAYPGNLMARYFSEAYFNSLDAPKRDRVWRIIRTGIENPDSQIGAYAQNGADYMDFEPLLEPMIRDHHNIPRERKIMQNHDWSASTSRCRLDDIDPVLGDVSMRVRVGRNLAAFPLPGAMTKAQRLEFEALMIEAFATLQGFRRGLCFFNAGIIAWDRPGCGPATRGGPSEIQENGRRSISGLRWNFFRLAVRPGRIYRELG